MFKQSLAALFFISQSGIATAHSDMGRAASELEISEHCLLVDANDIFLGQDGSSDQPFSVIHCQSARVIDYSCPEIMAQLSNNRVHPSKELDDSIRASCDLTS